MNKSLRLCMATLCLLMPLIGSSDARSISKNGFESCTTGGKATWDGGGDGVTWFDRENWSDDVLPVDGDSISIRAAGQQTIRFDGQFISLSILCLDSNQALLVAGGTLEITERGIVSPLITIDGGVLIAGGDLQVLEAR